MLDASDLAAAVLKLDGDREATESTVHYYTQVGILPPAVNRGKRGYTPEHLARFRVARALRRGGRPLSEIRTHLSNLERDDLTRELREVSAKRRSARPSTLLTRDSLVHDALGARTGSMPRSLRFAGGFALQCPPGASDELVADLYTSVEAVLKRHPVGEEK
jgi:DNA-binding transcriptional MerR regulator